MGVLSTLEERHDEIIKTLERSFGPVEVQSPVLDFSYTDYYDEEMGSRPVRYLLLFHNLVNPEDLAAMKILTNEMETLFSSEDGGRRVNLDPGILSLDNFILATCKDRSHRIPLRSGIYAEVTLIYQNRDFRRLDWTYADYSSDEVRAILRSFRNTFKALVREERK